VFPFRDLLDHTNLVAEEIIEGAQVESLYSIPASVDENEVWVEENPGRNPGGVSPGQAVATAVLAAAGIGAVVMGRRAAKGNAGGTAPPDAASSGAR